jgi:serine/threonine-protein kinase
VRASRQRGSETIAGTAQQIFSGDDSPATQATRPPVLALDSAGRVYVADFDNNRVRRLDPSESIVLPPGAQPRTGRVDGDERREPSHRTDHGG